MKNLLSTLLAAALLLTASHASASTWRAGVTGWATLWDPGALRQYQSQITGSSSGLTSVNREFGKGFMAGPHAGFLTQDKKWRVNAELLVFNSFTQDMEADGYDILNTQDFSVDFDVSLKLGEINTMVSYALFPFMSVFAGYTHQYYRIEIEGGYEDGAFSRTWKEKYKARVNMPSAGVDLFRKLPERMYLNLRLGMIYAIPSIDVTMYDIETGDPADTRALKSDNSIGFTSEALVGFSALKHVEIQAGYRFRSFRYRWTETGATWDTAQGVTLSASLLF